MVLVELSFKVHRTLVVEGAVEPLSIVKHFDPLEDRGASLGAFGNTTQTNDYGFYTNVVLNPSHVRPSAFAGWNQIIGGPAWGPGDKFYFYRGEFMREWSYNWNTESLVSAFDDAVATSVWPSGGRQQLWSALNVYGYTALKFNEFNQKNDWRWP